MPNRLVGATSPYLLQHQNNPVAWFPWSDEAIDLAVREDKPIFLSIGYAACHWCHVMEHESFENEPIAAYLNEHFVSIKVDREQRPDLDHIYMQAVQIMTGSGGWPMSLFLTPAMRPFYAGTYWPPTRKWGRPGFDEVLRAVSNAWQSNREGVLAQSDELTRHLQSPDAKTETFSDFASTAEREVDAQLSALLWNADRWLEQAFDARWGGFGGAPKFPHAMDLQLLMRLESRQPDPGRLHRITRTLDGMADGGIYDHLGGGFARYSVDERWLVPHFEKMLYDNALLASAYLDAFRLTGLERYATVVRETLDYVLSDLTDPLGGFYSTRDADSEGEEGKFYVWDREEILQALGEGDGMLFCEAYGVTFGGNFEGRNILHFPEPLSSVSQRWNLEEAEFREQLRANRKKLLAIRDRRVWPGLDDKVLCSWNALMISAMAKGGSVLGEATYLQAAEKAAKFIGAHLTKADGRLLHVWRNGVSEIDGFLEDYSYLADALLTLFECTGNPEHLSGSIQIVDLMVTYFQDDAGGFFFTANDAEPLITRFKDLQDGSVPSGNSMAANVLVRLGSMVEDDKYWKLAKVCLEQSCDRMQRSPAASGQMMQALDQWIGPCEQLVFVAKDADCLRRAIEMAHRSYRPNASIVGAVSGGAGDHSLTRTVVASLLEHRPRRADEEIALYACQNHTCSEPLHGWEAIGRFLGGNESF